MGWKNMGWKNIGWKNMGWKNMGWKNMGRKNMGRKKKGRKETGHDMVGLLTFLVVQRRANHGVVDIYYLKFYRLPSEICRHTSSLSFDYNFQNRSFGQAYAPAWRFYAEAILGLRLPYIESFIYTRSAEDALVRKIFV